MRNSLVLAALLFPGAACTAAAQAAPDSDTATQVQRIQQSIQKVESQLQESQQELQLLKQQLQQLQAANSAAHAPATAEPAANSTLAEQQAMQESQIATLDQAKVESTSKFPVRISGTILLNGFVNSAGTDIAAVPTSAIGGSGNTGLSLRQTMLGIDVRGPHLMGAESHADLYVDFFGSSATGGYNDASGLVRLRTAHASLLWKQTEAFFSLDRPLINPQSPTSLTAVAQPELAWSGNLWNWVPQLGVTHTFGQQHRLRMQGALIMPPDAPYIANPNASTQPGFTLAEHGRWPGLEGRVAVLGANDDRGLQVGAGGYFSRHTTVGGRNFVAWAGTVDWRVPLWRSAQVTGNAYYGRALGGLGAGGYKDYVYRANPAGDIVLSAPKDAGGWLQLKQSLGQRLEWNSGFGLDNVYASDLRPYTLSTALYASTARNRAVYSNLIFAPRASLLFSFEYRHMDTWPISGRPWNANIYGIAAGYRF